jgi:hypothetical protein
MATIQSIIGAITSKFKLDGSNYIDMFPVFKYNLIGSSTPAQGSITIRSVAMASEDWAINDNVSVHVELNHTYKDGTAIEPHIRLFPTTDAAGTVNFTYTYFVLHKDGTTSAGGVVNFTGTFVTNDKTNNIGRYLSAIIPGTGLVYGDMLCGALKRITGTYSPVVCLFEFGVHAAVGRTGSGISG